MEDTHEHEKDVMPLLIEFHSMQKRGCLFLFLSALPPLSFKRLNIAEKIGEQLGFTEHEVMEILLHSNVVAAFSFSLEECLQKIQDFYATGLDSNQVHKTVIFATAKRTGLSEVDVINRAKDLQIDSVCAWWTLWRNK